MEATNKRRENLSWPDQNEVNAQLEAIRELAKELHTDCPTDTPDEPTNWGNKARNLRNALIRAQFLDNGAFSLISGSEWLELFDLLGFSVDKETRKRFASHLNWYSFWYAGFKPRLSSKYAQRIHWYVHNFLFCLRNKLQTEKDYCEGKYGSKGQAYFMEAEQQPTTPAETPQNSTETAVAGNVSAKEENTAETAKYRISRFGGYKIIIGNREQGRVIAILMSVNGHNTIEISDESASIATMGEEPLQIDKPIMQLSDAEVLKLIYGSTEPPQSPATPQTIKHTTRTDKPRETARKEPKRTISKMERVHARHKLGVQGYSMFADASVSLAAINAPPIRGDFVPTGSTR